MDKRQKFPAVLVHDCSGMSSLHTRIKPQAVDTRNFTNTLNANNAKKRNNRCKKFRAQQIKMKYCKI